MISRSFTREGDTCGRERKRKRGVNESLQTGIVGSLTLVFVRKRDGGGLRDIGVCACVCVYCCSTHYKAVLGGRGIVEDMCYERRRAEACVD